MIMPLFKATFMTVRSGTQSNLTTDLPINYLTYSLTQQVIWLTCALMAAR